jgi:hypothetical protein
MQKLKNLDNYKADVLKNDFLNAYKVAKQYLVKWFDFNENSLLFLFSKLKLDHEISFHDLSALVEKLPKILNINMDAMFDEMSTLHKIYNLCGKDENFTSLAESKKWLLAQTKELPNITNLISFILSIPCTTAYVKRIFSIMTNKWTDTRN